MTRLFELTTGLNKEIIGRMKRFIIGIVGLGAVAGLLLSPVALAQQMQLQTGDNPVDRLQAQCDTIQTTLRRLHTNDSLLRVNIGQMYNSISVRLMARLNSRLALNRIDSTRFVEISGRFDQERSTFSDSYSQYETSLSALIKIDCKARPTEFYASLLTARDARLRLSTSVQALNDSVREYQVAVEDLRQDLVVREGVEGDAAN